MSYSDKVIDHYNHPRNVGSMDKSSPDVGTGLVGAPECGDVMKLQIKVNRDTNVIEEAKFKTFGCGSAIASSSLATEWVKGKTVGRSALDQEHGHREGAVASAGEDPLFGAGRGRDSAPPLATGRRSRRLRSRWPWKRSSFSNRTSGLGPGKASGLTTASNWFAFYDYRY